MAHDKECEYGNLRGQSSHSLSLTGRICSDSSCGWLWAWGRALTCRAWASPWSPISHIAKLLNQLITLLSSKPILALTFSFYWWYDELHKKTLSFILLLFWDNFRFMEVLRLYWVFPYPLHPASSNVVINIGTILLAKLQSLFRFPWFFHTVLFLFQGLIQDITLYLVELVFDSSHLPSTLWTT